jgi:hypothetical protein
MIFTALAVFSSLLKITGLTVAGVSLFAISAQLSLTGKLRSGISMSAGFVFGFVVGWLVLGQQLSHLLAFLASGLAMSQGYSQNMAVEPSTAVLVGGILAAGLAIFTVFTHAFTVSGPEGRFPRCAGAACSVAPLADIT